MTPLSLNRLCIVTSIGAGLEATTNALQRGVSGLRPCAFETATIPTYVGEVPGVDSFVMPQDLAAFDCRNNRLAAMAMALDGFEDAIAAAREKYGPRRIGLFLGTSTSGILQTEQAYHRRDAETGALPADFDFVRTHSTFSLADFLLAKLRLEGPAIVVSSACATTAKTFGNAARMIEAGLCDAAIVGGADSLCLTTLYGFRSLCLTSEAPCRPFDVARDGISLGEGAGFALVEKCERRGEGDAIMLLGVGESSDAYHMSTPHPDGLGARLAMERALVSAGLKPGDIDYINLHGTATRVGDVAEDKAVLEVFGANAPCSSVKGQTGHTLGASGIVEAIVSALTITGGFLPGTVNTREIDPVLKSRYVLTSAPARIDRVLSNSFGFGGSNCSLVLGRG